MKKKVAPHYNFLDKNKLKKRKKRGKGSVIGNVFMHEHACVGACGVVWLVCVSVPLVPSLPSATHKISSSDNARNRGLILEANQCLAVLAQREPTQPPLRYISHFVPTTAASNKKN